MKFTRNSKFLLYKSIDTYYQTTCLKHFDTMYLGPACKTDSLLRPLYVDPYSGLSSRSQLFVIRV